MRRSDKEIKSTEEIEAIIKKADICRLALSVNDMPYIVPLNFGYKDKILYFHSALSGKKIEMLRKNNRVCFEIDIDTEIVVGKDACNYTMKYKSVTGCGKAYLVNDAEKKKKAFDIIMKHYTKRLDFTYPQDILKKVIIIKLQIEKMVGKKSGY